MSGIFNLFFLPYPNCLPINRIVSNVNGFLIFKLFIHNHLFAHTFGGQQIQSLLLAIQCPKISFKTIFQDIKHLLSPIHIGRITYSVIILAWDQV